MIFPHENWVRLKVGLCAQCVIIGNILPSGKLTLLLLNMAIEFGDLPMFHGGFSMGLSMFRVVVPSISISRGAAAQVWCTSLHASWSCVLSGKDLAGMKTSGQKGCVQDIIDSASQKKRLDS